jgi:hypothetical protein
MARMIYKCKNKACKTVRTVEYPESRVISRGYGRTEREYFRMDSTGRKIVMGYEGKCACGSYCDSGCVKGFVTEHVCDARCTSATGFNCECQCGGKNHGADHQRAAA